MKPAWDQLMEEYAGNPSFLVADVDCTTDEGKPLCTEMGVRGYPTIKYGDPGDLKDYKGGRDVDSLKAHMTKNVKPICSPMNPDNCDDMQKAALDVYVKMSDADLAAALAKAQEELADGTKDYNSQKATMEDEFDKFKKGKSAIISMMKAVTISKEKKDEL